FRLRAWTGRPLGRVPVARPRPQGAQRDGRLDAPPRRVQQGLSELRAMAVVAAAITVERLAPAGERVARALGTVGAWPTQPGRALDTLPSRPRRTGLRGRGSWRGACRSPRVVTVEPPPSSSRISDVRRGQPDSWNTLVTCTRM